MERRFFPPDRNLGVYFEWYDSLTGVPSCQRTIAFEKACTLFNLGAIYTQIGARHDRRTERGLDAAVDSFLRAAGIFRHIYDTFTNAPSMDLKPQVLDVLVSLMLSQARECLFEKLQLQIEALALTESSHVSRLSPPTLLHILIGCLTHCSSLGIWPARRHSCRWSTMRCTRISK